MIDEFVVEEAIEDLKEKARNNNLANDKCNNFMSESEWEDDFSHNDIGKMQEEFIKQAKQYLTENHKGKYIIYCDWCVHICAMDFFNKNLNEHLYRYEIC